MYPKRHSRSRWHLEEKEDKLKASPLHTRMCDIHYTNQRNSDIPISGTLLNFINLC